jgi:hypothetical protein
MDMPEKFLVATFAPIVAVIVTGCVVIIVKLIQSLL